MDHSAVPDARAFSLPHRGPLFTPRTTAVVDLRLDGNNCPLSQTENFRALEDGGSPVRQQGEEREIAKMSRTGIEPVTR